jgi:hypothetical protein
MFSRAYKKKEMCRLARETITSATAFALQKGKSVALSSFSFSGGPLEISDLVYLPLGSSSLYSLLFSSAPLANFFLFFAAWC